MNERSKSDQLYEENEGFIDAMEEAIERLSRITREGCFIDDPERAWDGSPAGPVILTGVIAADGDELARKIRQKLKDIKSNIYSITNYEVISNEHEQKT